MTSRLFAPSLSVLTFAALTAPGQATTLFETSFDGSQPWQFDSTTDPNSQLGGTGQLTFTPDGGSAVGFATRNINISDYTTDETGTITVSGTLNLSSLAFSASDFSKRNFLEIGASSGNKSDFTGGGSLFELGLGGFNDPGEYSIGQALAIRYWNGGVEQVAGFEPVGLVNFVSSITVTGDDATGWTIEATTTVSDSDEFSEQMTSSYSRTDSGFNGLQSITDLKIGYEPASSDAGEIFVIDDVSLTLVPEPTSLALMGLGGLMVLRRRRA